MGMAEQDYKHFYRDKQFDITLDTSKNTPTESAEIMKTFIDRLKVNMRNKL